jgi:hypothetical protein
MPTYNKQNIQNNNDNDSYRQLSSILSDKQHNYKHSNSLIMSKEQHYY